MKKSIGIIGGAGPMAGSVVIKKIITICQKEYVCRDDSDFNKFSLFRDVKT